MEFKGTKNWRIRYVDKNDEDSFFFIEGDLEKEGFYPRVEVMQEDYGEHNGYTKEMRLADGKIIEGAYEMLELINDLSENLALQLGRLGCCGEGDGADHRADNDSFGGSELLIRSNILINKIIS